MVEMTNGILTEDYAAAVQIERELETEDLVLLGQLRRAQRTAQGQITPARPTLPYIADPSLARPGVQIAQGR
jgi:hypothetical protein